MQSHTLKARTKRQKSRYVGRGGRRGKTSGRGTKGQNARAGRKKRPDLRELIRHIPKLRGRGVNSNKSISRKPVAVQLSKIATKFTAGEVVSSKTLYSKKMVEKISGYIPTVKIVGNLSVPHKLTIRGLKLSASAKSAVEKAGGVVLE